MAVINPISGARTWRFELDDTETVLSRSRFTETVDLGQWSSKTKGGEMKIGGQPLEKDKLYYMRVRATYMSSEGQANTAWSPIISATYKGEGAGVEAVTADARVESERFFTLQGVEVASPERGKVAVRVVTYSDGSVRASKVVVR